MVVMGGGASHSKVRLTTPAETSSAVGGEYKMD